MRVRSQVLAHEREASIRKQVIQRAGKWREAESAGTRLVYS